jgi:hypothetical protein
MELETAKKLKYNDKILIKYEGSTVLGRFEGLSKNGYIHYFCTLDTTRTEGT